MKQKKWKNKNFGAAFCHSLDGLKYAFKNEKNFKIQLIFAILAIIFGIILDLSGIEFVELFITIGLVLVSELINTAIEWLADLYTEEYNEKIKNIKDISSAAVVLMSMISVIVGIILFLPKLSKILI